MTDKIKNIIKNKIKKAIRSIKRMLGICEFTGCCSKSIGILEISTIGVKTEICKKHAIEISKHASRVEAEFENGDKVIFE